MKIQRRISAVLALSLVLTLGACGDDTDEAPRGAASPGSAASTSEVKVGIAYTAGGKGDQSFNDSAAAGLEKARSELGVEVKELEATLGETDAQKEERLQLLAEGGYNPVIMLGFEYAGPLEKVAANFPDTQFAIVDDASIEAPNVANLIFAENEGSYLVGVIAAQASKTNNIGFIGGVNVPLIQGFGVGFEAGAKSVKPDITIQTKYLTEPPDFSGFSDPAKGKTAAQGMLDTGADIIYTAAGGSGSGTFEAVQAKAGAFAIGVDTDQYLTAPDDLKPIILTSMLKRVDTAVYDMVKSVVDGSPLTGTTTFDLSKDGVGYSTSNSAVEPFAAGADKAKAAILDKSVTVPSR